ncbi:A/G-specific adenine glycosylase [Acholeplasma equirhinis]|uniref:A/G-specific adenine glycosylase n=1 Tax=Acholeplasma equirhinis TaxID=555393 RepID=UPI00197AD498|nr:A/G-specific adenine glycosylase [Acholeplasma equirhinis]MBN3490392.1 A/G-specific adenine glycosylase [Acholeplasma equirhinis]
MDYQSLFKWYELNHRKLPFRETKDPYKIWVSEVMLQQTQVETVLPFYDRFLKEYPSIQDLSEASLEEVLNIVQGIGYYKRFKLLKKGAEYVVSKLNGIFPDSYDEIIKIPGIGAYTAGAISSISFNKPHAATDGNVIRVLSRLYQFKDDFRFEKNRKKLNQFNQRLIESSNNPHDYTQSMMELGATVCKKYNPSCETCPLKDMCKANQTKSIDKYPFISPLKEKKETKFVSFVLKYQDQFVLRKRSEDLLNSFYEFIQVEADSLNYAIQYLNDLGFEFNIINQLKPVKHIFTHLVWYLDVYEGRVNKLPDGYELVSDFSKYPIATVHKKIINQFK